MSLPSWVPAVETKPAPMPLLLVQSFVNTWEGDSGIDLLADPASARRWLAGAGLLSGSGRLGDEDLIPALAVRESIRALLVHNGGGPAPTPAELRALNALARSWRLQATVAASGLIELRAERDSGRLRLGTLLLIIRDSQQDGTWKRLKACHKPDCRWAFYDRSHASRGAWCDMAVCGNRVKNRNLRSRRQDLAVR
jgi:predicted RNA-binding Zn ribbon-like protein